MGDLFQSRAASAVRTITNGGRPEFVLDPRNAGRGFSPGFGRTETEAARLSLEVEKKLGGGLRAMRISSHP